MDCIRACIITPKRKLLKLHSNLPDAEILQITVDSRESHNLNIPPFDVPPGSEDATWIVPELVCVVKYMQKTATGGLRQPVFNSLRDDKAPEECIEE